MAITTNTLSNLTLRHQTLVYAAVVTAYAKFVSHSLVI